MREFRNPERGTFGEGWAANFFDESLSDQLKEIRGDQLVRVFYEEKDINVSSTTNYHITKVVLLPSAGNVIVTGELE